MEDSTLMFRKSSYSAQEGQCVEVAILPDRIAIRDSKNPTGPALVFPATDWMLFLDTLRTV
ncbi:DUF397 domain-containing protein [Sphaerisporangium rubeum]|uniref:DUF397 domain-containing protein n=1 Tax=Sphaerisporangium rubeum TaxID=321317 RepID=A0A7X0M624_9ACTN|nr:DUF397 domain-containing protein [Sphaerisporangium rubeum]MBB6471559.1 hypothetical protein [Sphaerisporangium rubeum]